MKNVFLLFFFLSTLAQASYISGGSGSGVNCASGSPGQLYSTNGTTCSFITASGTGTVTSAGLHTDTTTSSIFANTANVVTGSPITAAGNFILTFSSQSQNLFLASPNGSSGVPVYRSIVAADIPTLNQNTSGTAAGLSAKLAIASGGTNVTSVTTAPTASSFAGWDANSNFSANSFLTGYATTATAAGTTTLTVSSAQQQYFTGTTTQTVKLPAVTGLALGTQFTVVNLSTGVVTLQSSGANTLQAMAANTQIVATSVATSGTGTAVWNWAYQAVQNSIGGGGGVTSVTTFGGSQTNGMVISGTTIALGQADATNPGGIPASGAQTIGATWTLNNPLTSAVTSPAPGSPGTPSFNGANNATSNATAASPLVIQGGNKTAGTGNGGDVDIYTGLSSGGNAGQFNVFTYTGANLSATPLTAINVSYSGGASIVTLSSDVLISSGGAVGIDWGQSNNGFTYHFNGGLFWSSDGGSSGTANIGGAAGAKGRPNGVYAKGVLDSGGFIGNSGYQRVASATSAGSTTLNNNVTTLALHASGTLTSYTVTTPATPVDGQIITVTSNFGITSLTLTANSGQTVTGGTSQLTLGSPAPSWIYVATDTNWYPF